VALLGPCKSCPSANSLGPSSLPRSPLSPNQDSVVRVQPCACAIADLCDPSWTAPQNPPVVAAFPCCPRCGMELRKPLTWIQVYPSTEHPLPQMELGHILVPGACTKMDLCHMSTRVHIVHPCPYRPPVSISSTYARTVHLCPTRLRLVWPTRPPVSHPNAQSVHQCRGVPSGNALPCGPTVVADPALHRAHKPTPDMSCLSFPVASPAAWRWSAANYRTRSARRNSVQTAERAVGRRDSSGVACAPRG